MATLMSMLPGLIAAVVIGAFLFYVNKKSGQPLPVPTGNLPVDAKAALANFELGLSNLTIVKDAKAFGADAQTSAIFLAVAAVGHEVGTVVDASRQAAVQAATNALLTELVAVASPTPKA